MDLMSFNDYLELIHSDKFRALAKVDPKAAAKCLGMEVDESMDVKISQDNAETIHIVMPPQDTSMIEDDEVSNVAGGAGYGTASISQLYKDLI